jgi:hypothetical protein
MVRLAPCVINQIAGATPPLAAIPTRARRRPRTPPAPTKCRWPSPAPARGLAAVRARGCIGGRPTVVTPEIIRAARDMLPNPDASVTAIARLLGVRPGTLYNHIPDLRELRPPINGNGFWGGDAAIVLRRPRSEMTCMATGATVVMGGGSTRAAS